METDEQGEEGVISNFDASEASLLEYHPWIFRVKLRNVLAAFEIRLRVALSLFGNFIQ